MSINIQLMLTFVALTLLPTIVIAAQNDSSVAQSASQNAAVIAQGKLLYEGACSACHGRNLGGAFGFNLKDGEWIHGSQPQEITYNINNGFIQAGMPGFKHIYSKQQIESIVSYILSKREGFDNLSYTLYQMNDVNDRTLNKQKIIKQGKLTNNLADFQLPEVQHYIIEFEGDFYSHSDKATRIWIEWGRHTDITFEVDGVIVERDNQFGEWKPTWPLKQGKQHLKITYRSGNAKPHERNIPLIITNDDMSIKLFAASVKAKSMMEGKKHNVNATHQPIVQRIKTMNLPPYSISVGLPEKINYAFNTRLCTIVGLWQGEMLNIGPNISGRGEDASLLLGEWIFHYPQSLKQHKQNEVSCKYKGYELIDGNPIFTYELDGITYKLTAHAENGNTLHFKYATKNQANTALQFNLPVADNLIWYSPQGKMHQGGIAIITNQYGDFSISTTINSIE